MNLGITAVASLALAAGITNAGVFDESTLGDFSDDWLAPTAIDFELGTNTVINTVVNSNSSSQGDRDYYTFTLEEGEFIDSITIISSTNLVGGADSTTFFGLSFDSIFDFDPDAQMGPGLEGFVLTNSFGIGRNVVADVSGGLDLLGPGDYSIWSQQTGPNETRVEVEFNVVPTPGTGLILASSALIAVRRRR